jgi:hypothetical protein
MLGHSIVSQHFMELEGSIPNSQQLSTCSYPEPDQSSPHRPIPPLQDHLQVLSNNIIKVKLLIFLCRSTESLNHFTAGVCYIAKIQYNILRLDKVLKIP